LEQLIEYKYLLKEYGGEIDWKVDLRW